MRKLVFERNWGGEKLSGAWLFKFWNSCRQWIPTENSLKTHRQYESVDWEEGINQFNGESLNCTCVSLTKSHCLCDQSLRINTTGGFALATGHFVWPCAACARISNKSRRLYTSPLLETFKYHILLQRKKTWQEKDSVALVSHRPGTYWLLNWLVTSCYSRIFFFSGKSKNPKESNQDGGDGQCCFCTVLDSCSDVTLHLKLLQPFSDA